MKKWRRIFAFFFACMFCIVPIQTSAEGIEENETAERIQKAEEIGVLEWIDEEGYLIDSFFVGKSDAELSNMSLDGLIRVLSEEEIDAFAECLKAGIGLFTVSSYQKLAVLNPNTGGYLYTGIFEVDGILAYCIERDQGTPAMGSTTSEWIPVHNDDIRKVLYYGYNGPADCGYSYGETAMAVAEANDRGDNSLGRQILAEIKQKETPPSNFLAWKVETNGGTTQDLAFYTYEEKSYKVELKKVLEGSEIMLAGASFKHTNPDGTEDVQTTGEDGKLIWENLQEGTHLLEELEAPAGYIRNANQIVFTVDTNNGITVVSEFDKMYGNVLTECDEEGNLLITVENKIGYKLPNTGSYHEMIIYIAGSFLAVAGLKRRRHVYEK